MVIGDDDIHTVYCCLSHFFHRRDAKVDSDDELHAALGKLLYGSEIQAISFRNCA